MTSAETRKKHEEARRAKEQEAIEIREKMKKGCISVLNDSLATSAEKIKAVEILHDLMKGR